MSKNKKKILSIAAFLTLIVVVGYVKLKNQEPKTCFIEDFREFHDLSEKEMYQMKSGFRVSYLSLNKGKKGSRPIVVFSLYTHATVQKGFEEGYQNEQECYKAACEWMKMPADKRKVDMREAADLVIDFALKEGWKDYYLYVQLFCAGHHVLYDYERDALWVPEDEETRIEMCEKFGSFAREDVAKTQAGQDYLVEMGWAYWDKKKFKIRHDDAGSACYISIGSDGDVMDMRDIYRGAVRK